MRVKIHESSQSESKPQSRHSLMKKQPIGGKPEGEPMGRRHLRFKAPNLAHGDARGRLVNAARSGDALLDGPTSANNRVRSGDC